MVRIARPISGDGKGEARPGDSSLHVYTTEEAIVPNQLILYPSTYVLYLDGTKATSILIM